jgi:hypothetical protein
MIFHFATELFFALRRYPTILFNRFELIGSLINLIYIFPERVVKKVLPRSLYL